MLPEEPLSDGVVTLRPWREDEADWYVAQAADPDILRFTREEPDLTAEQVRTAIAQMHATRAHAGMVITDAATGELLGNAGLAAGDEPAVGHVSYWVAAPARGRGVATRAVRLLVDWAGRCGMRQVRLWAKADNVGSQRVAERAGFHPDGTGQCSVRGETWDVVWYAR